MDEINIGVVKESFGKVAYSHKTQEKAKEINKFLAAMVKWLNVILIGLTTISATRNFFNVTGRDYLLTAVLATISLMFVIAQLSFNPEGKARTHKNCADRLWLIREKYLNLIADMTSGIISNEKAKEERDKLTEELFKIYDGTPSAGGLAYQRARKALKIDEELSFNSKEIEQLLPESLRSKEAKKLS